MSDVADYLKAVAEELASWQGVVALAAVAAPVTLWVGARRVDTLKDRPLLRYLSFAVGAALLFWSQFSVWQTERELRRMAEQPHPEKVALPAVSPTPGSAGPTREVRYLPSPSQEPPANAQQRSEADTLAKREEIGVWLQRANLIDTINQNGAGSEQHITQIAEWQAGVKAMLREYGDPEAARRFDEIEPLSLPAPVGVSIEAAQRIAKYRAQKIELGSLR